MTGRGERIHAKEKKGEKKSGRGREEARAYTRIRVRMARRERELRARIRAQTDERAKEERQSGITRGGSGVLSRREEGCAQGRESEGAATAVAEEEEEEEEDEEEDGVELQGGPRRGR